MRFTIRVHGRLTAALAAAVLFGACADPPKRKLARAELAVEEATGAETAEHAPLELHRAQEKLRAAREAADDEEYDRARRLAEQALVDAQLAQAKADAEARVENAEAVRESIEMLAGEAQRTLDDLPTEGVR